MHSNSQAMLGVCRTLKWLWRKDLGEDLVAPKVSESHKDCKEHKLQLQSLRWGWWLYKGYYQGIR